MPPNGLLTGLLTVAGPAVLGGLHHTVRLRVINRTVAQRYATGRAPAIGVFFHRHIVVFGMIYRRLPSVVMISRSKDGEVAASALRRTAIRAVRGSSSSGGREALTELIDLLRAGATAGFACDGPRGPSGVVKIGCVVAAARTGVPLVPVACAIDRPVRLRTWDRMELPLPGARVAVAYGDPMFVPPGLGESDMESRRAALQADLERLHAAALARVA